jgi:ParB/RepB/Spo0J family partition protein
MTTETPATPYTVLRLSEIAISKTNPRTHFDGAKLLELGESILRHGVLQPILVRPSGSGFELVAGERRYRASKLVSLETIPAVVRELNDKATLEIQVVENLQREDLHPLEEAEGYARLIRDHGYDADSLALKIGKSRSYVYARMKLSDLSEDVAAALVADKITHSVALLIARIPDEKLQEKALAQVVAGPYNDALSHRRAKELIQREYMLHLNKAKFDTADEKLLPLIGACTRCPNRTGNQADLFGDIESADVCTLPPCFRNKEEATWQAENAKLAKKGVKVLPLTTGEKLARWGNVSGAYVEVNDTCPGDPERRKISALLPKDAKIAVLRDGMGKTRKVIAKKDLAAELARAGHTFDKPVQSSSRAQNLNARDWELERDIDQAVGAAIAAAVELVPLPKQTEISIQILRGTLKTSVGSPARLKIDWDERDGWADRQSGNQIFGLLAESAFSEEMEGEDEGARLAFLASIGVDPKAITKRVTAKRKAEKEFKAEKPAKATKAKGGKKSKPIDDEDLDETLDELEEELA